MGRVVITYIPCADIDCMGAAYAYAELLKAKGEDASYFIGGDVQKEVKIVCEMFDIKLENELEEVGDRPVVIVDTNKYDSVSYVPQDQIVEVIDHHPESGDTYKNAKVDMQRIGAVCTMIAERFKESKVDISRESAILLYYGIASNTINFKSQETTDRDVGMASWLKEQCQDIDEQRTEEIFRQKCEFDISDLRENMEVEQSFTLGKDKMIIGQLELTDAKGFLQKHKDEIDKVIAEVIEDQKEKEKEGIQTVFINLVDIFEGYHLIYANQESTRKYLEGFGYTFEGDVYRQDAVVQRKTIKNYLKEKLKEMQASER